VPGDEKQLATGSGRRSWRQFVRLFVAGTLCLHAILFFNLRERVARGYPDFTVFYTAAMVLRNGLGHQLYVGHIQNEVQKAITGQLPSRVGPLPYIHPPFEALIFVPLTLLPYRYALLLWDLLNVAILFGVALLLRSGVPILRLIPPWEFVVCSLAFFPVFECLLQGQDSILQLLFCVLAWHALKKDADVLAGCWFALGAFKFQFMLPVVLLLVVWKRRRVLIGFAAVSSVLVLISIGLVGWEGLLRYPIYVFQIADTPSVGGVPPDFLPNLHGLAMGWPFRFSGVVGAAAIGLSSVGVFLFAALKGGLAADAEKRDLQLSMAIAVSVLIGWQTNVHDFTLLALPMILMADYCARTPLRPPGKKFALLFPISPILISPVWLMLWFVIDHLNLIAIPVLAWVWALGVESSRPRQSTGGRSMMTEVAVPGETGSP
jgi:hypothetical protein